MPWSVSAHRLVCLERKFSRIDQLMAGRFLIKKSDERAGMCNTRYVVYQFEAIGFEFD